MQTILPGSQVGRQRELHLLLSVNAVTAAVVFHGGVFVVNQRAVHLHLLRINHFDQARCRPLAAAHLVELRRDRLLTGVDVIKPGAAGSPPAQVNAQHYLHRARRHPKIPRDRLPAAGAQQALRVAAGQKTSLAVITFDKHSSALILPLALQVLTAHPGAKSQLLTRFNRQRLQHVVVVGGVVILIEQAAPAPVAARHHLCRGQ
ncbi:hypothetical protein D3C81_1238160 [compost metagenome]